MSEAKYNKYHNARIYRVICGDLTYIGSTCQSLANRMSNHRCSYIRWKNGKTHYVSVFQLFEIGSPEIVLVEAFKCENKEALIKREQYYKESTICVNIRNAYCTNDEKKEQNRVHQQRYRENHLEQERERIRANQTIR